MSTPSSLGGQTLWTPKSLLDWSTEYFSGKQIGTARLDSELLLAHVLDCRRIDLYLQFDRPMNPDELAAYRALVRGRALRTPVAYLIGEVGFWNLMLKVGPGCLIPRQDTETLVETVLDAMDSLREQAGAAPQSLLCVEVGTGSGAIPLAVCSEREHVLWLGCEFSADAMAFALANRRAHAQLLQPRHNSLFLLRGNGLSAMAPGARPHIIVSNPPYIPSSTLAALEPEVSRAEPGVALDGGFDGLNFYRELVPRGAEMLAPGGRLILEIGADQGPALREIVQAEEGLELLELRQDLGGRERVVHAIRR